MTKQRKLICYGPFCHAKHIKHNRDKLITYHHKHYCRRCWEYLKKRNFNRWQLYKYIERKAMVTFPTGVMLRDIKNLRKRHYTYHGIHIALDYANKKSMNFNFNGQYFLRYVPFVYDKAQEWQYNKDKQNQPNINSDDFNNQNTLSVNSKVFKPKIKKHYYDLSKF